MPEYKNLNIESDIEKSIKTSEKIEVSKKEQIQVPEQKFETPSEKQEEVSEKIEEGKSGAEMPGVSGALPTSAIQRHKEREKEIERVLEQDLEDFYLSMGEEKRMEFKISGEKTARAINTMIETGKLQAKKIIELIRQWLSIVPGINKFFVEQQTKIKTDKIMQMKK